MLRRRGLNEIDTWDSQGRFYQRALVVDGAPVLVRVRQTGSSARPALAATVHGPLRGSDCRTEVARLLKRLLGSDVDLSSFYSLIEEDPAVGPIAEQMKGVKPPRLASNFETLINGVAGQLISLEVTMHLLNRLTQRFGLQVEGVDPSATAFPGPEQLAGADPQELRDLGFSFAKARTIIEASKAVVNGDIDLENLSELDDSEATAHLTSLWGIGRWTAEYVLLRGDGRLNIFPGDDIGARNSLTATLGSESDLDYDGVREITSRWQPYAGMVYFHLLLNSLNRAGKLNT